MGDAKDREEHVVMRGKGEGRRGGRRNGAITCRPRCAPKSYRVQCRTGRRRTCARGTLRPSIVSCNRRCGHTHGISSCTPFPLVVAPHSLEALLHQINRVVQSTVVVPLGIVGVGTRDRSIRVGRVFDKDGRVERLDEGVQCRVGRVLERGNVGDKCSVYRRV